MIVVKDNNGKERFLNEKEISSIEESTDYAYRRKYSHIIKMNNGDVHRVYLYESHLKKLRDQV